MHDSDVQRAKIRKTNPRNLFTFFILFRGLAVDVLVGVSPPARFHLRVILMFFGND